MAPGHPGTHVTDHGRPIQDESDRFGAVPPECDPTSPVPTCPEWTAVDLLGHLVTVQRFRAVVIGDRLTGAVVADCVTVRLTRRSRSPCGPQTGAPG